MARVRGSQIYSPEILEELKTAMAQESRQGQDDEVTFKQKMNALQRFLNHGMSRFSIDTWHHALHALFQAYKLGHSHDNKLALTQLKGVSDLRVLSHDVILQREGGSLRETDTQALKYLDKFMAALQCVREAKSCISDMYRFLYRFYYDPDAGRESSHMQSAKLSRSTTMQPSEQNAYETSAKQFGILTLQQMSGSTWHKLRRTVADMEEILKRWDRLMSGGEIQAEDLDAESKQDLLLLSGTAAFEHVLRLLPDIFAKYYKCLELAKQWWVLAHEIYPELPINRPPTPSTPASSRESLDSRENGSSTLSPVNDTVEEKVPFTEQLVKVEEEIQVKENLLQSLQGEVKLLEERERHFNSLMEAYEKVTAELDDKMKQRKDLGAMREKETLPQQNQLFDANAKDQATWSENKAHDSVHDLDAEVEKAEREIQMLQFQQSLLMQDYMLQLEVRPSIIRFTEDLRLKTEAAQKKLTEHKIERLKLQTLVQEGNNSHTDRSPTPPQDEDGADYRQQFLVTPPTPPSDKTAEKKLELSRLHARPLREDTSGSSVTVGSNVSVVPLSEPKRKKSHPERQGEKKGRQSLPSIKIDDTVREHTTDSVDASGSQKKSPKMPAVPSSVATKSPRSSQKATETSATQNPTEPLFQRRAPRKQETATTDHKSQSRREDQPISRPRAKSDPHALKPGEKVLKLSPEPMRRLKTVDLDTAVPDGKPRGKKNSTGSSSNPKTEEVRKNSNPSSHKTTPPTVERKENNTSQKSKPGDVRKDSVATSQKSRPVGEKRESSESHKSKPGNFGQETSSVPPKSKPGETNSIPPKSKPGETNSVPPKSKPGETNSIPPKSKPGETNSIPPESKPGETNSIPPKSKPGETNSIPPKSKPGDVRQETNSIPPKAKPGDVRQETNSIPPKAKPGDVRQETNSIPPKAKPGDVRQETNSIPPKAKPGDVRQETNSIPPKAKPGDVRQETNSIPPKAKPGDVRQETNSIPPKAKPGDVRQETNSIPPKAKPGDVRKNGGTSPRNSKTSDSKKDSEASSHKIKPTEVKKDSEKISQKPKPGDLRKDGHVTSQGPRACDDKRVSPNPKTGQDKGPSEVTSHKATQKDVRKDTSVTPQKPTQGDGKNHNGAVLPKQKPSDTKDRVAAKANHKPTEGRKDADVTSQKSSSTGTQEKTSQPNGVVGKRRQNYANV